MENRLDITQIVHDCRAFLRSRRCISVLKGALVYTLAILLPFLNGFNKLSAYPATYSAMVIVAIAAFPGKSVGECVEGVFLALLGVCIGAGNFAILAKLRVSLPAQAIVFGIMVYILALLKAYSIKFFSMSLLAILMSFNGVYISIQTGGFSPEYLESYIKSYFWGGALVIGVNILVFPISSERQLRETLVLSLDHISTFAHLLAKTYTMTLTDEDREVRDRLNQTIRADFGLLTQKIGAASIEINWSRWSLQDYKALIGQTRTMQLNLIALYSSLGGYEKQAVPIFVEHFLPTTIRPFHQLRRDLHRTIVEIQEELGCHSVLNQGRSGYEVYFDLERQDPGTGSTSTLSENGDSNTSKLEDASDDDVLVKNETDTAVPVELTVPNDRRPSMRRMTTARSLDDQFREVSARLQAEAEENSRSRAPSPSPTPKERETSSSRASLSAATRTPERTGPSDIEKLTELKNMGCANRLRAHFKDFEQVQRDLLTEVVISGTLHGGDDTLHVEQPRPSVWEAYGPDHVRGREDPGESKQAARRRRKHAKKSASSKREPTDAAVPEVSESNEKAISSNHSLMLVFSMLFALNQFTETLAHCHATITAKDSKGRRPRRRLRFHLFERLTGRRRLPLDLASTTRDAMHHGHGDPNAAIVNSMFSQDVEADETDAPQQELSMKEALALLEGRTYTPEKPNIWLRLSRIEGMFRTPTSIYAAKCAAAALTFGALIWAPVPRPFFLAYTLASSLLTVVVALSPTLGQSLRSFVFQIGGSSLGYLIGMAFLEIFKDVGGYHFNPYGVTCLVALYSLPMAFLLYERPQYFTGVLLAMNGTGVLIISEYVSVVYSHKTSYGEPPIRVGKALAGLAIAIAIVIAFQLLVLRNPARRTLRKALASLVYSSMSYDTILRAFVRGTMPVDPTFRPPQSAINKVLAELTHREHKIQGQILSIMPLVGFAKDEPQFSKPFQAATIMKIIRANQVILDRMSESRSALGSAPFSDHLLQNVVSPLSPYRRRLTSLIKAHFCLCAASLSSKSPLPHDTGMESWLGSVTHDALVVSRRFAQTDEGKRSILSGEFTRYWFYLLSISSVAEQLKVIEEGCKSLFGEIEDDPRLS